MEDWKSEFYSKYSSYFGHSNSEKDFEVVEPYAKYIVKSYFPKNLNARILDLGCGSGNFIRVFLNEGYKDVKGVDLSDDDISYAHSKGLRQIEKGEILEYMRSQENHLYDVVLFLDVLEHFTKNEVFNLLREAHRILNHNGRIIIHVPNAEGIFGSKIRYSDVTHEGAFTAKSLAQTLTFVGFINFHWREDKPLLHSFVSIIRRLLWIIGTLPFRILHGAETGSFSVVLSQNILFKAEKN